MIRVVTRQMDELSQRWAENLRLSGAFLGIEVFVKDRPFTDEPERGFQKPGVILEMMDRFPEDSVLWVDPETTIHYPLDDLTPIKDELAYRIIGMRANDRVVFVNPSGRKVIESWDEQNRLFPRRASGINLEDTVRSIRGARVTYLEPAYCWHEQTMRKRFPSVRPVIEYHKLLKGG